jgi:molybdate transport system ATP-binding protein
MNARLQVSTRKRLGGFEHRCDIDLPLAGLTALFGASGAGKSTLVSLIAGLLRPDSGRIAVADTVFFDGSQRIDLPVHRRELGIVFQDARLFPHLSVRSNLLFGFKRAGARAQSPSVSFDAVVALLGLEALLERRPHTLSGGERQRVAIGRALLAQPRLLLMDEPLASLDAPRKAEVLPYIERLRDEFDLPILYVSHAVDEVLRLATALVLFDAGAAVAAGPLTEVLDHPRAAPLRGGADAGALVFGAVREHDPRYGLSTLACEGFALRVPRVDLPIGAPVRLRIPAREVALALSRPSDVSITNRIEGTVERVVERTDEADHAPLSAHLEVQVRVGPNTVLAVAVTRESAERLALAPGLRCWCLIKSVALHADALALAYGRAAERTAAAATRDVRPSSRPAANDARAQNDG